CQPRPPTRPGWGKVLSELAPQGLTPPSARQRFRHSIPIGLSFLMTLPSCPYLLNSSPSRGAPPGNRSLIAYRLTTGENLSDVTIMPNEIVLPAMRLALTSYPFCPRGGPCSLNAA